MDINIISDTVDQLFHKCKLESIFSVYDTAYCYIKTLILIIIILVKNYIPDKKRTQTVYGYFSLLVLIFISTCIDTYI